MVNKNIDIKENQLLDLDSMTLSILLKDNSSGKNIIWATDDYSNLGYAKEDYITIFSITGKNGKIIKPRVSKTKQEQITRIRNKAEVFTPSWICNKQNNLIDNAWFEKENVFNIEIDKTWITNNEKVQFPKNKTWQDYILSNRLEITCGEAPYLASRYDSVSGEYIPLSSRIGILDRKLRIVCENVDNEEDWYNWSIKAVKSIYGYEWQGDSVLLARENLLYTFIDYYENKFSKSLSKEQIREVAYILSWNIWQMDGLKFVIPNSCKNGKTINNTLFGEEIHEEYCEGCRKNNYTKHNGTYCYIMDWEKNKKIKFLNLLKK